MRRLKTSALALLSVLGLASGAAADPTLRVQFDQRGDFVMFGNSSGYECASGAVPPIVGDVTCPNPSGRNQSDSSPDLFWRSEEPGAGQATADGDVTAGQARTTAVLEVPAGATITYARIYWAGLVPNASGADDAIVLQRPGGALDETVMADDSFAVETPTGNRTWYQSTADITDIVAEHGVGAYRVGGIASIDIRGMNSNDPVLGWVVVVMYQLDDDPPRNLALFDGLDMVQNGEPAEVSIDGFLVPDAGFDAKMGVVTYEGEASLEGDALLFNGVALSDAVNDADNFFNSSRSYLGVPVTVAGDLPQLSGEPNSMSGLDFDVVDVKAQLSSGDTSATIEATSSRDRYLLGVFVTSISTFKPDFRSSNKTFVDVNGGSVLAGDVLEYTIDVVNSGNDTAVGTVLTDELPDGLEYVKGSLEISSGANDGKKTDAAGDDQAEFDEDTNTITVRLGEGANATRGGRLEVDATTSVKFRARVRPGVTGSIFNQAVITAEGEQGAPSSDYPTDGNGDGAGAPPTETVIGGGGGGGGGKDSDGDGLTDEEEIALGSDPNDADSDDDGVPDGLEPNPGEDTDGDGLINVLDPDSDNDGLWDGTEMGRDCNGPGTAKKSRTCRADADGGATTTDPLNPDTDGGGVSDGSEDSNLDGKVDEGEGDPNDADDDDDIVDSDGDGLSDALEATLGSDPNDADSDDDGVPDGLEANPADDTDGDGLINVLDPDSDNDGLWDGTEMGRDCDGPDTDLTQGTCIPDADGGKTTTSPLDPDTDDGGVRDGDEDRNKNGRVDAGETDPNDGSDDRVPGGGVVSEDGSLEGGGCSCRTSPGGGPASSYGVLGLGLLAALGWRRRSGARAA